MLIGLATVAGICLCLVVILFVWLGNSAIDTPDEYVKEYGGSLEVYQRLLALTDCQTLQDEFDLASTDNLRHEPGSAAARWTTGYMTAADQRMKEVGCYK